jgi:hypothetical protein
VTQVVILAYLSLQQARSTRERIRRRAVDEANDHNGD